MDVVCDLTEHECDTVSKRITSGLNQWHWYYEKSRRKATGASELHTDGGEIICLLLFLDEFDCKGYASLQASPQDL